MSNTSSSRLAVIEAQLLELVQQRVAILQDRVDHLRQELAEAEGLLAAEVSNVPPSKKKRASKKRGAVTQADPSQPKKKTSGTRASKSADRLEQAVAVVQKAGAKGISAKQLSEKTGIPYGAIRKLLSESGRFLQKGEKRASRIFLK